MNRLSEHYFGELEAFDEANSNPEYFSNTFVKPTSLSTSSLRHDRSFIVIGRKGVGKTAIQMAFAKELEDSGYFTHHFRFMYDLRSDDYAEVSATQSDISYTSTSNDRSIFLHYDFRDVWERVFFRRIGETLKEKGHSSAFTELVAPNGSKFQNIFEGLRKGLKVKLGVNAGPILAEIGIDLAEFNGNGELPLKTFNRAVRELFKRHCDMFQFYFFVDELVFSRLDAKEDEVTLRAAMVRDVLRTAWELNMFCASENLAFHFVCSLRPEVRNLINDYDSEAGKFLDGKDVELSWFATDANEGRLIVEILKSKVISSHHVRPDFDQFFTQSIRFGSRAMPLEDFLLTNTWGRPRDVVRLLLAIKKKSPNSSTIGEHEIKAALDDYSRSSAKELVDELGVSYGADLLAALRNGIKKKNYSGKQELGDQLDRHFPGMLPNKLLDEMFELGFIGGVDRDKGHFFWSHRGETYLKPHHDIRIHPALWNEFSIR